MNEMADLLKGNNLSTYQSAKCIVFGFKSLALQ